MLRYLVERIADGKFLELELPIVVSASSVAFCGAGRFSGQIVSAAEAYRFANSDKLIDPWATFIHEEDDGVITGTWVVTRSSFDDMAWTIEGQGFSACLAGAPYTGEYFGVKVSPVVIARHVVEHAQSGAGADFGIKVTGASDERVGTDSDLKAAAAKKVMDARKKSWDDFAKPRKKLEAEVKTISKPYDKDLAVLNRDRRVLSDAYADAVAKKLSASVIAARKKAVADHDKVLKAKRDAKAAAVKSRKDRIEDLKIQETPLRESYEAAKDDYDKAKDAASKDDGAWKILWWDTPDVLDAFQDAVDAAGQEWVERSRWNAARTKVIKELAIVPRVGRLQDRLAFIEGDNVIDAVVLESDGSKYANSVVVIGAGEGRDALRVSLAKSDSRRRRTVVVDAKEITKKDVLERRARSELDALSRRYRVAGVRVINHPNAEFGAFGPGDTITVSCDVPWLGRQEIVQRIREVERVSEDVVDLVLGDS